MIVHRRQVRRTGHSLPLGSDLADLGGRLYISLMTLVPPHLRPRFRDAGWFEGRHASVDPAIYQDHPASEILHALGGLELSQPSPNVNLIAFKTVSGSLPVLAGLEAALNTKLFGIAEQDDGHAELYVASRGQVIGCSLVHSACWFLGATFASSLEALVRGERARPIMLPGDTKVSLYGQVFRIGEEGVLSPSSSELR